MPNQAAQDTSQQNSGIFYGYILVVASALAMALIFSVHYAFGVFFKPLSAEFGWTRAMTAGAFSLVWIMQGLLSIVMGGFNDKFGPRMVLSVGALLIGGGYLLTSQTHALWQLYVFYGLMVGAGLGSTFVPLTSTTARWFVQRRGAMTGIVTSGIGVGALVGPPLANRLIANYNWRVSYLVLGAVVLVGVMIAAQFLRRSPAQMGLEPYGAGSAAAQAKANMHGLTLMETVSSWQFWMVLAVFFCYGYVWTAVLLHLAPNATDLGLTATTAANIVAMLGAGSILGKVLMGIVADKIGNKSIYILCFAILGSALIWLTTIKGAGSFYLFALTYGFAYGGLAAAHSPLVAWLFGIRKHGLIFGVCFNGWTLGCAVGPIVAGHIFDVTHSYRMAFLIGAGVCLAGMLLTLPLKPALLQAEADGLDLSLLEEKTT